MFQRFKSTAVEVESPSLSAISDRLAKTERKLQIFDLGPPNQSVVEYLAPYPCSLQIADLPNRLSDGTGTTLSADCHNRVLNKDDFKRLVPYRGSAPIDLIIAWDYFNYFNRDTIICLMDYLSQSCGKGSVLYFMTFIHKHMPNTPGHIQVMGRDRISMESNEALLRTSPRYAPRVLQDMMPSFNISKLSLVGNGLQENVFVFDQYRKPPKLNVLTESSLIDYSQPVSVVEKKRSQVGRLLFGNP